MLCAIKNCIISLHLQLAQIFPLPLIEAEMCNFPYLNCDEDKKKKKKHLIQSPLIQVKNTASGKLFFN